MFPIMLFDKGDPREAYAIAENADQDKALRGKGYLPLTESGLHPDQFREFKLSDLKVGDVLTMPDGAQMTVAATAEVELPQSRHAPSETVKRGPGRPRKE